MSVEYDNSFWLNYVQTAGEARTKAAYDPTTSLFFKLFICLDFKFEITSTLNP